MIKLNSQEYEKLANGIVNDYFHNETPLTEGVYKVATDRGLNPHQVKQLVWHANTRTHLDLFEKQSDDKAVEFPLADVENIVRRMYTPPEQSVKVASTVDPITDFFGDLYSPEMEKAANRGCEGIEEEEATHEDPDKPKKAKDDKSIKILVVRKTAAEVSSRAQQHTIQYQEAVEDLRWELRKLANHPDITSQDINQIEIDARSHFGQGISPVLSDIGLSSPANEKTAMATTVTDSNDPFITKLKLAKDDFDEAIKYTKVLNYIKGNLASAF